MRRLARLALPLAALAALCGQAPPDGDAGSLPRAPKIDPCAPRPQLYVSAMGQPFRSPAGEPDPMAAWFAQADSDHDGQLSKAEFLADADRFFATLDLNHDGEIDPQEVSAYELNVAPEIRLYQRGLPLTRPRKSKLAYASDALGAGRFSQLNIPEPVASADADYNRGVSLAEFRAAAAARFALLDPAGHGTLAAATIAPTPQQAQARLCAAYAAKHGK